jgi:hypothetical protein
LLVPPHMHHMRGYNADGSTDDGDTSETSKKTLIKQWYGMAKDKNTAGGAYLVKEFEKCIKGQHRPKPKLPEPEKPLDKAKDVVSTGYENAAQNRMGAPFSLPVMQDRIGRLCRESSLYQDFVFGFMARYAAGAITGNDSARDAAGSSQLDFVQHSWFSQIKADLIAAAPSLFCLPPTEGLTDLGNTARSSMESQVQMACQKQEKEFNKKSEDDRKSDPFNKNGKFDRKKCKEQIKEKQKEEEKKVRDQQEKARKALDQVAECIKPAKVWELARNNNFFMVSWGWGMKALPSMNVECKPYTPPPNPPKPPYDYPDPDCDVSVNGPKLISAQAEMQFTCKDTNWLNCDPNAMWRWDWSAIPRKDAGLVEMIGDAAALTVATSISHGVERFAGNFVYKKYARGTDAKYGNILSGEREMLQQWIYEWIGTSKSQDGKINFH